MTQQITILSVSCFSTLQITFPDRFLGKPMLRLRVDVRWMEERMLAIVAKFWEHRPIRMRFMFSSLSWRSPIVIL